MCRVCAVCAVCVCVVCVMCVVLVHMWWYLLLLLLGHLALSCDAAFLAIVGQALTDEAGLLTALVEVQLLAGFLHHLRRRALTVHTR